MSVKVLAEALDHSAAKGTDRCVLLALADAASHDGVTWLPILPARARGVANDRVDERKCITHRANCSKREALRAIGALAELGEIEVRQAQRGQKRINVYRITVGQIADSDVDYDRLPFALDAAFGTEVRGANLAPRAAGFDLAELAPREVPNPHAQGDNLAPHGVPVPRARVNKRVEPSEDPAAEPSNQPSDELRVDPAAEPEAPPSLQAIEGVVGRLARRDPGTVKVIEPLARQLPAQVFLDIADTVAERCRTGSVGNDAGLLVRLLRIEAAHRQALFQQRFLAELPPARSRQSWIETVVRDQPAAYVAAMARHLTDAELAEVIGERFDPELREQARAIRDGEKPAQRLPESPTAARTRWIDEHLDQPEADVFQVIDSWDDVDPIERQSFRDYYDRARQAHADTGAQAA